jgi:hypothetical protein
MGRGRHRHRPMDELESAQVHQCLSKCGILFSHDVIILVQNLLMKYHIDLWRNLTASSTGKY